ncbi:conserved hypothetical protein [Desulfonatronospira thiodismutans ASO3-1]|uniref:Uncharacterized protein n=1 Tax=Desulfonatronospira thiodismutans ASO3-1 TaxID=555779 RepID=D6SPP4_9BACT|nr:type VI secretion system protein IglI family protein [Desulfonatronospira thiodismutans]EFI34720.1 conserved hypothetical protein [Desulfonatronospira thiodismutans ASO3-1]
MQIELIQKNLEEVENPGLETTDPRLMEISGLAQSGDYHGAAASAEALLQEDIYDVRLLGFFIYGLLFEKGPAGFGDVFASLAWFLENNWSATGPVKKRNKHAMTSFRWLFNQSLKKLQYEESFKGDTWQQWLAVTDSDDVEQALDTARELQKAMSECLEDEAEPLLDLLSKIVQWLRSFQPMVYREQESDPEEMQAEEQEPGAGEGQPESSQVSASKPASAPRTPESTTGGVWVEGSYHLLVLMKKLEIFQSLCQSQDYAKAAVVADDIMDSISQFDPKLYLPKLFSGFFMCLSANSQDILGYQEMKDSPEWQIMREYLNVDPDGFVES